MSSPPIKVENQGPAAQDKAPNPSSEVSTATEVPTATEQVSVNASSKPAVPSASPVPVASPRLVEPQVSAPNPTSSALPSPQVAAPLPSGVVVTAAKLQQGLAAVAPPATGTSAAPVSASAIPTNKPKSKKKKGIPTVTMATAPSASSGAPGSQGENTGRWTAEEHRLFLQGLEQHGKGWKKIASLIKSRTVVQIRTHAQKYFQKLAKARQNGEEGDVAMEGRGGSTSVAAGGMAGSNGSQIKRRRQTTGTKRKAISSVVSSAQRHGKKMAAAQAAAGVPCPKPPLPAVAPALAPFVVPNAVSQQQPAGSTVPSISTAHGTISGPALEDSLFRFLTPAPVASTADPLNVQVNDVARQAGANAITVPTEITSNSQASAGGEISPTGVNDAALLTAWTDAKDMPTWYSKGADVDCLLDVADSLDWLVDTGDLHETYQPPPPSETKNVEPPQLPLCTESEKEKPAIVQTSSVTSFGTHDSEVPPLPSLFDGSEHSEPLKKQVTSSSHITEGSEEMEEHLNVFDTPMEEHAFVSALLENNGESSGSLPVLS